MHDIHVQGWCEDCTFDSCKKNEASFSEKIKAILAFTHMFNLRKKNSKNKISKVQ